MFSNKKLNELKTLDTSKVASYLINGLRGITASAEYAAYSVAYVIVKAAENETADLSSLDLFVTSCKIEEDIALYLSDSLRGIWDFVIRVKDAYDTDMYAAFLLFNEGSDQYDFGSTPESILKLAIRLLDIKDNDNVADFCDGKGSFIRECFIAHPEVYYHGFDIALELKSISHMRANILGGNIDIIHQDVNRIDFIPIYDKIFSDGPLAMKMLTNRNTSTVRFLEDNILNNKKMVSLYWMLNIAIINTLKEGGKAVTITNTGSLFRADEKTIRRYFVDNGYIDTIILLPTGMYESHRVSLALVVLGKKNNGIRLVDASNIYTKGRRYNTLSDENLNEIINLCSSDNVISKYVTIDDIKDKDYNLYPHSHFEADVEIADGVKFNTVIKNITRGAQLKAAQFDQLTSEKPTKYQYLMLSDIQKGQISKDLKYLSYIEDNLTKYCIKNNSLIISKSGTPIKNAVATIEEDKKVLATGNLYVIELNESKVNPYFIKAFLDSDIGSASLKSISAGAVIPNISVEALKNMIIPLPSMEIQNEIANNYLATLDEINYLRSKLSKAEARLTTVYNEGR